MNKRITGDVYTTPLYSALEPLEEEYDPLIQEGFDSKSNKKILAGMAPRVATDSEELNNTTKWGRLVKNRADLKALAKRMQPELNLVYPEGEKPASYGKAIGMTNDRANSLKMQIQDDTTTMIQGSNNIFVLSGIAVTTISIFIIVSML